jgi:hypothetical protein
MSSRVEMWEFRGMVSQDLATERAKSDAALAFRFLHVQLLEQIACSDLETIVFT